MLAGKKIGPCPRVRQYQLETHPTIACLEECLKHVSNAPSGANVNISWPNDQDEYTVSLSYNLSQTADSRAYWKSYRKVRHQSELLWEHCTNDITLVYNLITEQIGLGSLALENEGILSTKHNFLDSAETRHNEFVRAGLRDNLRHFIAGMQSVYEEEIDSIPFFNTPIPALADIADAASHTIMPKSKEMATKFPNHPQALRLVDSLDLRRSKPLLEKFMVPGLKIFSRSAFLFLLEQEYYKCLHNNNTMSLLLYRVECSQPNLFFNKKTNLPMPTAEEIAKRITANIQRKTDILCLYDNDIFAILVPQTNVLGAKLLAQRIEKSLHTEEFTASLGLTALRISFGIAGLDRRCKTLPTLLGAAELALDTATKSRTNIVIFDEVSSNESSPLNFHPQNGKVIEPPIVVPDLTGVRTLAASMLSPEYNIFSYQAFLIFAKYELQMAARNRGDLSVLLFRIYKLNSEGKEEIVPPTVVYEFINNIAAHQQSADILAQFWDGNFVMIRPNTSRIGLSNVAKRITNTILETNLLRALTDTNSLRVETKLFNLQKSNTSINFIDMVSVD